MKTIKLLVIFSLSVLQSGCKSKEWKTFSDDQIGFTMKWRPNWEKKWVGDGDKKQLVFALAKSRSGQAAISISKGGGRIPVEIALSSDDLLGADAKKDITVLAGRRAGRLEGTLRETDAYMVLYQLNGADANYAFQCYVAPAARWGEYRDECKTAADSFHLTAEQKPKTIAEWSGVANLTSAKAAYEKKDYDHAVSELQALAKMDNPEAQYLLGKAYAQGHGVEQNMAEAANWYERSANHGFADAQASIGAYYLSGISVPKDFVKAHEWLLKGAKAGSPIAMINLGHMYAEGKGVSKDINEAIRWYIKAADGGASSAYIARSHVCTAKMLRCRKIAKKRISGCKLPHQSDEMRPQRNAMKSLRRWMLKALQLYKGARLNGFVNIQRTPSEPILKLL